STTPASAATVTEADYEFAARVDAMRCHSTKALRSRVADARREQQRWYLEELAATLVLDERHALDATPDPSVSARTAKTNREVARSLESLPEVAAAAWSGDLSKDQLVPVTEVATPATDAEWARRGCRTSPVDLQRQARATRTITAADAEARRAARYMTSWRDADQGMVFGRWALPDVDGVLVEQVLDHMAERMRPATGAAWDSLAHRKADAFVELCTKYADTTPSKRAKPLIVVHTNRDHSASEVDGIPIATETFLDLATDARVVEHDDDAAVTDYGDGRIPIPVTLQRELQHRDRHCRYPGCEHTRGLQHHHLDPVTWGGHTSRKQLARLCPQHHRRMEPHGTERLIGDPDLPDGLTVKDARAGPAP
ncbi:MAG: HNH endonuclease, partial [Acidimicrobiia bacterium]|nr:HNH endonuclease [Acidimicrobiia bacterium]